jgi:hypothetical protein
MVWELRLRIERKFLNLFTAFTVEAKNPATAWGSQLFVRPLSEWGDE